MQQPYHYQLIAIALLLTACNSIKSINPFNASMDKNKSNIIEYVCNDNKRFALQPTNQGQDIWLIYPDHQVNLSKKADNNIYTYGAITLEINGDQTKLNDGDKMAYSGCKPLQPKN